MMLTSVNIIPVNELKIGLNLKRIRGKKNMTQEQLAKKSGLSRVGIAMIEVGIRKNPAITTCVKLAKGLGVPISKILM